MRTTTTYRIDSPVLRKYRAPDRRAVMVNTVPTPKAEDDAPPVTEQQVIPQYLYSRVTGGLVPLTGRRYSANEVIGCPRKRVDGVEVIDVTHVHAMECRALIEHERNKARAAYRAKPINPAWIAEMIMRKPRLGNTRRGYVQGSTWPTAELRASMRRPHIMIG